MKTNDFRGYILEAIGIAGNNECREKIKTFYRKLESEAKRMRITWTCHVCGRERPDDKIQVYTTDLSHEFGLEIGTLRQNVRYCEDNAECVIKAPTIRLVPPAPQNENGI